MAYEKSIEQLKLLIEHFNNGGNDFNATDIEAIKHLLKENENLRADYGNKSQVERDLLYMENEELNNQLEYFRSNEYLNQLRFERDILQDIANKGEISKEDKDFIDCTHRNTELLEENQKLKKQLENNSKINVADHKYASKCEDKVIVLENQQEEFIKWLEDGIQKVTHTEFFDERIQRAGLIAYNRCLQKYKSIIGDDK